jgi:hypothetical protein
VTVGIWLTAAIALVIWQCSPPPEDLPDIKNSLRPSLTVTRWPAGEAREAWAPLEPDLQACVAIAWRLGCHGHLTFELLVDEWGNLSSVAFDGERAAPLRACVERALSSVIVLPAVDSHGNRIEGSIQGSLSWRPDQTGIGFGNVAGVIPTIRDECVSPQDTTEVAR